MVRAHAPSIALVFLGTVALLQLAPTASATPCPTMDWRGPGSQDQTEVTGVPYYMLLDGKSPEVTCIVVGPDNIPLPNTRSDSSWRGGGKGGFSDSVIKKHFKAQSPAVFHRGHLMADNYFLSQADKKNTYVTVNQIPQLGHCNGGWWASSVEAKVSEFMKATAHHTAMVFVGSHGNVNPPTTGASAVVQHRKYMWTAVCDPGKGFYFVGSNPNTEECKPQIMDAASHLPVDLQGVIGSLQRVCGNEVLPWARLPTRSAPIQLSSSASLGGGGGGAGHLAGHSIAGSTLGSTPTPTISGDGGQSTLGGGVDSGGGGPGFSSSHIGHFRFDDQGNKYRIPFQGDRGLRDSALRIAKAKKRYHMGADRSRFGDAKFGQLYRADKRGKMQPVGAPGQFARKKIYEDAMRKRKNDQYLRDMRSRRAKRQQLLRTKRQQLMRRDQHGGEDMEMG